MTTLDSNTLKYLTIEPRDEEWGLVVTTVGRQSIDPNANYPAMQHPASYDIKSQSGRVLDEYQIVYIVNGGGVFESQSLSRQRVDAGTVILLFPGENHKYSPDKSLGWQEYWIGFKGDIADRIASSGFFTLKEPLIKIGMSNSLIGLYRDAIRLAERDGLGGQQLLSSIVVHMLGHIIYKSKSIREGLNRAEEVVRDARQLMREGAHHTLHAEDVAKSLGVGYSWFRQNFKRITGVSPAQHISRLLIGRAKEMLVSENQTISEIAYILGFESVGQFSTLFRKIEGITPRQFCKDNRIISYKRE